MAYSKPNTERPKDGRARIWTVIVYEDSAPENWREIVAGLHVPYWISPLHDKDLDEHGERKKPHYHVVLKFGQNAKKSVKQVQAISDMLSGVKVIYEKCAVPDLSGMVRYLVHYDDPAKAEYSIDDIACGNGAEVLEHFQGAKDVDLCVGEMMEFIDQSERALFSELARYARDNRPD